MTVVVGAGITGLAVCHYLDRAGAEPVVIEAAPEPGGVIRSTRIDGAVVERGPHRTRLTEPVRELVDAGGLADALVEATDAPLYLYRSGRLRRVPTSVRGALRTDLLSIRGKLRALLEPFADPPRPGETVHAYLERALGREVADVVGPVYGGLYGTDPTDMSVDRTLGRALAAGGVDGSVLLAALRRTLRRAEAPPVVTVAGGLQRLALAVADRHREAVRLSEPARSIERAGSGYLVETDRHSIEADDVVVTTPADVAADLLETVAPDSAAQLRRLRYNPLAVVTLSSAAALHGAGYQVPHDEPLATLGATWDHCLFGREGRYTCYLGGSKDRGLVDRSDDWLGSVAAREFETVTGHEARPIDVHRVTPGMPAFDTSWTALDRVDLPTGIHLCTNFTGRAGIPGRVREARRLARSLVGGGSVHGSSQASADHAAGSGPS